MRFHPFDRVYKTSSAPQHSLALALSNSFDSVGRWPRCCGTWCFMRHWLCHWVVDFHHCVMIPHAWHQNLSHLASVLFKFNFRFCFALPTVKLLERMLQNGRRSETDPTKCFGTSRPSHQQLIPRNEQWNIWYKMWHSSSTTKCDI